ncbi:hypothetical protein SELMODRAFT_402569 [Selaginella moellendorffii]|uniref:Uncharacterized protein n=1 Tax=Selaginella moellendorffii TaxID=88036 RepID=D8QR36_SELML|nr:hypothetical protein SELMODRAFT_402569 [Selaginella moellendorffii]
MLLIQDYIVERSDWESSDKAVEDRESVENLGPTHAITEHRIFVAGPGRLVTAVAGPAGVRILSAPDLLVKETEVREYEPDSLAPCTRRVPDHVPSDFGFGKNLEYNPVLYGWNTTKVLEITKLVRATTMGWELGNTFTQHKVMVCIWRDTATLEWKPGAYARSWPMERTLPCSTAWTNDHSRLLGSGWRPIVCDRQTVKRPTRDIPPETFSYGIIDERGDTVKESMIHREHVPNPHATKGKDIRAMNKKAPKMNVVRADQQRGYRLEHPLKLKVKKRIGRNNRRVDDLQLCRGLDKDEPVPPARPRFHQAAVRPSPIDQDGGSPLRLVLPEVQPPAGEGALRHVQVQGGPSQDRQRPDHSTAA